MGYKDQSINKGSKKNRKWYYVAVSILLIVIISSSIFNAFQKSLFFGNKDRINIIMYGDQTTYYSLGIQGAGNYTVSFSPDIKIQVPGGYGYYRVGGLGKLISLDKQPEIYQRTFSLATFSFTDYYFYPDGDEVYFGKTKEFSLPSAKSFFSLKSNASMLDRLYLALFFFNKRMTEFQQIPLHSEKNPEGDSIFSAEHFEKNISGYLFQKSYRNERKSVQILYTDQYANADRIAKLLEGNGIRVGDVSQQFFKECLIIENTTPHSATAKILADVFDCKLEKGKTDLYDILFQLGEREKDWGIKAESE